MDDTGASEGVPPTANSIQHVTELLRSGQDAAPITVRKLLGWFGYSRRSYRVVSHIRRKLHDWGLVTVPDFEAIHIDGQIHFEIAKENAGTQLVKEDASAPGSAETPLTKPAVIATVQAMPDPTLRLSRLAAANKPLLSIKPDALLSEAVTQMLNHDYSQLPVMIGNREVKGVISWLSIGTRLCNGVQGNFVRDVMDPPVEAPDYTSLFAAIPMVVKHGYLLVRTPDRVIAGIVTSSDLSLQFLQLAEPFLLLGEIENYIRRVILSASFNRDELMRAVDPRDAGRVIATVEDMSFGEYVRLLQNEAHWQKTGLKLDRTMFCRYLDDVRRIRNDVMHFDSDGIDEEDLEKVRRLASMFQRLGAFFNS